MSRSNVDFSELWSPLHPCKNHSQQLEQLSLSRHSYHCWKRGQFIERLFTSHFPQFPSCYEKYLSMSQTYIFFPNLKKSLLHPFNFGLRFLKIWKSRQWNFFTSDPGGVVDVVFDKDVPPKNQNAYPYLYHILSSHLQYPKYFKSPPSNSDSNSSTPSFKCCNKFYTSSP